MNNNVNEYNNTNQPNMNNQTQNNIVSNNNNQIIQQNINNQTQNINTNHSNKTSVSQTIKNNKTTIIMIGAVVGVVILLIIIRAIFGKTTNNNYSINNYKKEEQEINNKFQEKDYVLATNDLLIEIKNNASIPANATIKVEFYDENKSLIDVKDTAIIGINIHSTSYAKVSLRNIKYDSYKVTSKLSPAANKNFYNDDIKITSTTKTDNDIIIQYKNTNDNNLDSLQIGVLFYDDNHKIIAYNDYFETSISAQATSSTKVYIPFDENFKKIQYSKVEVIVLNAIKYNN